MKFVALVSGGKDSCFNISYCQENGHELVAAASLRAKDGIDELDSFLYQTVGQDAIEYVGRALGVPLYRRVISGSALETGLDYGTRAGVSETQVQDVDGDETEDLFRLLQEVKVAVHHPEIEGVSVGAILSNYQRTRVEHVCRRLGLTSLSYLWQRDQGELLQEMIDAGVDAVLIKVAGIGLKPQHLGTSLATMQPLLQKMNAAFGSHICGEGGEYETLTLDCPAFVKRISITETETVIQDDKDFATVAYLRIKSATLEEKGNYITPSLPSIPSALDSSSENVYAAAAAVATVKNPRGPHPAIALNRIQPSKSRLGKWLALGNVTCPTENVQSIEDETLGCFNVMKDMLVSEGLALRNVVHVNALLASITDFAAFNHIYATMFGTAPPSRACVAVNLAPPCRVVLECYAYEDSSPQARFSLHVQGISYWAPANIGPYSQAIHVDDLSFISGQIGLIPHVMALPDPLNVVKEVALALQHIRRIRNALPAYESSKSFNHHLGFIIWTTLVDFLPPIAVAVQAAIAKDDTTPVDRREASILFVIPSGLPKGAAVEIQTITHARTSANEGILTPLEPLNVFGLSDVLIEQRGLRPGMSYAHFYFKSDQGLARMKTMKDNGTSGNRLSTRIFHSVKPSADARRVVDDFAATSATTLIPVNGIYRMDGHIPVPCEYAIIAMSMPVDGPNPGTQPYFRHN